MHQYKTAVEDDGLATYLISGDWQNPDQVKQIIIKTYQECPSLEGLVLIGDVPVALVRNAQHMTTAFKMNEKAFPWDQSSVPTDRFYDDLNLKFEFIRQDSVNHQHFYYKLTEDSPQRLNPTFYSARIKYPEKKEGDKYAAIASYLKKAAAAKADKHNQLDRVFSFNGASYNSDCLIVWMDDEKAYMENFPLAFGRQMGFKHWNFRMKHPMKYKLFSELQRKDLDLFMFHEHGMPTGQLINDELACTDFNDRYKMLKSTLYNAVMSHVGKRDKDTLRIQMQEKRQVNEVFFKDLDNPKFWEADSLHYADERIVTEDLMKNNLSTNPRLIMFDACYNGSFHENDYIAGQYIFNNGQTLVAQGNTRNVLQDRWTIEMIGLLSHGVRAGQYNKLIVSLEGHLFGDPTFRFAPIEANTLSIDITIRQNDVTYWKNLLNSPYADVQSLAMRMLADADTQKKLSPLFLEKYQVPFASSSSFTSFFSLGNFVCPPRRINKSEIKLVCGISLHISCSISINLSIVSKSTVDTLIPVEHAFWISLIESREQVVFSASSIVSSIVLSLLYCLNISRCISLRICCRVSIWLFNAAFICSNCT